VLYFQRQKGSAGDNFYIFLLSSLERLFRKYLTILCITYDTISIYFGGIFGNIKSLDSNLCIKIQEG
jgi:hypothetical protein